MGSKREMIKCKGCKKELVFDEQFVKEIDGIIYCHKCANKLD